MSEPSHPSGEEPVGQQTQASTGRLARAGSALRGVAIDITPLRSSRDFRVLWLGELVSMVGRQITVVALPYQVFLLSRSSLAVGMVGLAQLLPLIVFSVAGGAIADRIDRRKLLVVTEAGIATCVGLLLLGAIHGAPPLWYLYSVTGIQAGIGAVNHPARVAAIPNLVRRDQLPAAMALNQVLFNSAMVVGPAAAGFLVARFGLQWAYAADLLSSSAALGAAALLRPLPPSRTDREGHRSPLAEIREGFAYLRRRRVLVSAFAIDLIAMIFGMPRALFPVLALEVFHVGAQGLGLMHAAPALGALAGALTSGWVGRVRRQGLAVIVAVLGWGGAIAVFGLSDDLFWLALVLLAAAGSADVISAVFRGTILQMSVPDSLRGRTAAVHIMVVTGGPRLGDVEAGVVASLTSPQFSVVSGGLLCVIGAIALAFLVPELAAYRSEVSAGGDGSRDASRGRRRRRRRQHRAP